MFFIILYYYVIKIHVNKLINQLLNIATANWFVFAGKMLDEFFIYDYDIIYDIINIFV